MRACGLDFGTSNSGVALPDGSSVRLLPLEGDATSLPSAVFFADDDAQPVLYGRAAVDEYLDGTPGRLMRALKSLLGSRLIHETTAVGHRTLAYADIVTLYLRTLRERASAKAGGAIDAVVLGRPIRFDDDDAERDREAERTLAACARAAGFRAVPSRHRTSATRSPGPSGRPGRHRCRRAGACRIRDMTWWDS